MFCVYLISYRGNKLPPFYIGSSSVEKIQNGYRGSVKSKAYAKTWKTELTANPHLFKATIISTHDNRKDATLKEHYLQTTLGVIKSPLYVNMAVASIDGFFGMNVSGELNPHFGKKHTPGAKIKMSKPKTLTAEQRAVKAELLRTMNHNRMKQPGVRDMMREKMSGVNNPQYGKRGADHPHYGHTHTDETKTKIRDALLGKKKTAEHIKHTSTSYKIQRESDMCVFTGYGLTAFSKALGLGASSFLYTLTSQKFRKGFRILENLGVAADDHTPLTDYM